MGKTHSILITFDANEVPNSIKYMGAIHRCTPYRGSPDACTNCRQPGHRHDVCPSPKTNLCPRCGTQHLPQEPPCTPKCILCEGSHLTGTGSCKGRNLHQPRKQIKQQAQQQEPIKHVDDFPQLSPGPTQPSQQKQAWPKPPNQDWGPPRSSSKQASSLTATSTLQDALAKSREEAAAAKAEAQAARAEAAALREHIAKLEAQISALATSHAIQPIPAPTASPPPPPNPVIPSHVSPASSPDSLEIDIDTELPGHSTQGTTPPPSPHPSLADIPTLLESFTARFEAKLQEAITSINQECTTLKDAVIRVTTDNAALNHRFDALTQGLTDRYNNLESQLYLLATRRPNRDLNPSKRKKPKSAEGQDNPISAVAHDSQHGATAPPLIDSHDGSSKP
ncbi:hypothetical protein MTO96_012183 [Rhipicephalus appendiculatus]